MTTFLLIRHAHCDPVGRVIAGRTAGVHLNAIGKTQAQAVADRLGTLPISAVYSSPLERAIETAQPLACRLGVEVLTADGLNEVDFGDWTGRTLVELDALPEWGEFNSRRSTARIPNGESMSEVVARAQGELDRISSRHRVTELVAVVSHGDVLRGLLAAAAGIPLDLLQRLEVAPASVSVLSFRDEGTRVLLLNSAEGWPEEVTSAR